MYLVCIIIFFALVCGVYKKTMIKYSQQFGAYTLSSYSHCSVVHVDVVLVVVGVVMGPVAVEVVVVAVCVAVMPMVVVAVCVAVMPMVVVVVVGVVVMLCCSRGGSVGVGAYF